MISKRKKAVAISSFLVLCLAMGFVFFLQKKTNKKDIPVSYMSACWAIDITNLNQVVGYADQVFIGYVNNQTGTDYSFAAPLTMYDVTVISNIKGDAPIGETVTVAKDGGLSKDGSVYILYENDSLLEVGQYYAFCTNSTPEGYYLACGPTTTKSISLSSSNNASLAKVRKAAKKSSANFASTVLSDDIVKELEQSDVYSEYQHAFEHELPNPFRH